jgi:hypothetical protein
VAVVGLPGALWSVDRARARDMTTSSTAQPAIDSSVSSAT